MLPRIIGLLGRSRVGKDTVANTIQNFYGHENTIVCRLSQPLKDAVKCLYGFTHEQVEGPQKESNQNEFGVAPRQCIQGLCDYIMERHGVEFFSNQLFAKIDHQLYAPKCVIIPDVRYPHDIEKIRARGGIVIKVTRDFQNDVPKHVWEDKIDAYQGDVTIHNAGSIHDLEQKLVQYLQNVHQLTRNENQSNRR